jgi:Uma2 family endonuclease
MGEPSRAEPVPVTYPTEDDLGETLLHFLIRSLLVPLVRRYLEERGWTALVGSDQFVYWVPGNPQKTVAPDLYLVPGADPRRDVRIWQVWVEGVAPKLAVEIVSDDVAKDYEVGPRRYAELGVDELVVYDPDHASAPNRVRWQAYRRRGGQLVLEERTAADRVWCETLGCFLREVHGDDGPRVRLGVGPGGEELFPTADEALSAAEAEIRRLRAELARRGS